MTRHIIAICIVLVCIAVACSDPSVPPPTVTPVPASTVAPTDALASVPTATSVPTPTVAPTETPASVPTATPVPTPTVTPVPSPTPEPTPDLNAMADDCELAHVRLMATQYLDWTRTESDALVPPPYMSPDTCDDFRDQFPDEHARLIGNVISGTFTLLDDDLLVVRTDSPLKGTCWGRGGYNDISSGLGVVIKDGAGTIIAKDELWAGKNTGRNECTFPFYVSNVPDADFYTIEVGRRGSLVYSRDEITRADWSVAFSLGSR